MPGFKVVVEHSYERTHVAQRLRGFADQVREAYVSQVSQVVESWDEHGNLDFSFRAMGFAVSGRMSHESQAVLVNGTIPLAAWPMRGMIEQKIADTIREVIHNETLGMSEE